MGKSIDELLSGEPSPSSSPSPDPAPAASEAAAAPEAPAPSEPEPAAPKSEPAPEATPKADDPPKAETKDDKEADTGQKADKAVKDGPPPSAPPDETDDNPKVRAAFAKSKDETRKRQEIERQLKEERDNRAALQKQLDELNARLAGPPQPRPQQPVQPVRQQPPQQRPAQRPPAPRPPDPDVDPGQAIRYLGNRFQQELARRDAENERRLLELHIVHSRNNALARYSDYEDMENVFADEMDRNPSLRAQMESQPDPAGFAYQMGKRIKALQEVGPDPLAWKQKQEEEWAAREDALRKEVEAEIAARYAAQQPQPAPAPARTPAVVPARTPAAPPSPPPSLAGVTSAAPRTPQKVFEGPTPLSKLLG